MTEFFVAYVKPAPVYLFKLGEKIAHLFLHSDILTRLYSRTLSKGEVAIASTTIGLLQAHLIPLEQPNHPSKSRVRALLRPLLTGAEILN